MAPSLKFDALPSIYSCKWKQVGRGRGRGIPRTDRRNGTPQASGCHKQKRARADRNIDTPVHCLFQKQHETLQKLRRISKCNVARFSLRRFLDDVPNATYFELLLLE